MKHMSSRALHSYWNTQRGKRAAPERAEIDPGAIRHVLADTFVLAVDFVGEHRFRLAGTKICTLFGHELKDQAFAGLWEPQSGAALGRLLDLVTNETAGIVAGATGFTEDGATVDLELLLLPLAHQGHSRVRAIGALVALNQPYWLGTYPLTSIKLGSIRHLGQDEALETPIAPAAEPLPLATSAVGGRMRHGFIVVDGGRAPQTPAAGD